MPSSGAKSRRTSACCWPGGYPLNNGSYSGERRMNLDFVDLLRAFAAAADVRFLIVGASVHRFRPSVKRTSRARASCFRSAFRRDGSTS